MKMSLLIFTCMSITLVDSRVREISTFLNAIKYLLCTAFREKMSLPLSPPQKNPSWGTFWHLQRIHAQT